MSPYMIEIPRIAPRWLRKKCINGQRSIKAGQVQICQGLHFNSRHVMDKTCIGKSQPYDFVCKWILKTKIQRSPHLSVMGNVLFGWGQRSFLYGMLARNEKMYLSVSAHVGCVWLVHGSYSHICSLFHHGLLLGGLHLEVTVLFNHC